MRGWAWLASTIVSVGLVRAASAQTSDPASAPPGSVQLPAGGPPRAAEPAPLTTVGAATWSSSLGLVQPGDVNSGTPSRDAPAGAVPSMPASSVTELDFRWLVGGDKGVGAGSFSVVVAGGIRYEARHLHSLFAPWVDGGVSAAIPATGPNATSTKIYDLSLRAGIDWHPARTPYVGFGPFIGYRQLDAETSAGSGDPRASFNRSVMVQGLDVGGQLHVRSREARLESAVDRPAADAVFYAFVQGAGLAETSNRAFVGALASFGSDVRFFTNVEVCASQSDTCYPRQARGTLGLGGMW